MKHRIKALIWLFLALTLIIGGCSFDKTAPFISIENWSFALPFDNENFDFTKLYESSKPKDYAIGESLKVDAIIDSSSIGFEDLRIGGSSETQNAYYTGTEIPAGTSIPEIPILISINGIPEGNNAKFRWAMVDTGKFKMKVFNGFDQLEFRKIYFTLTNKENSVIFTDSISDLQLGKSDSFYIDLHGKKVTNNMEMDVTLKNYPISGSLNSQGVLNTDFLTFDYDLEPCSFDSAEAIFANQVINDDSLYAVHIEDIIPRSTVLKNAELRLSVKNDSPFELEVRSSIDNFVHYGSGNLISIPVLTISPNSSGAIEPLDVDSAYLELHEITPDTMGVQVYSKTYCRSEGSGGQGYVKFVKGQEAKFYITVTQKNEDQNIIEKFNAYIIDGKIENRAIEIENESQAIADDINWDDYSGLILDSLDMRIAINVNRDGLRLEKLVFDSLYIQGKKADGSLSELKQVNLDPVYNVNDTTILLPNNLVDIINFHPDSIIMSGKILSTFDGKLYHTDEIETALTFGVPLTATIDTPIIENGTVIAMDSLLKEDGDFDVTEIKYFRMDAKVNNASVDAACSLFVNISDTAIPDHEGNDSLVGDIKSMFKARLAINPSGVNNYLISSMNLNMPNVSENGINIDSSVVKLMLHKNTYIQPIIKILPTEAGQIIKMNPEDFIGVQLKTDGKFKIKFKTGDNK